jgi:hypothetical protein
MKPKTKLTMLKVAGASAALLGPAAYVFASQKFGQPSLAPTSYRNPLDNVERYLLHASPDTFLNNQSTYM